MNTPARIAFLLIPLCGVLALLWLSASPTAVAAPKPDTYWQVDDVKAGMKGVGRTVMKGVKVEEFDAEVLGVLKNTSPGRDMVLCRLSGLGLEKTGVIAGMSGSPDHHRRQAARRRRLRLALRQGADRRRHAVLPDERFRRGLRAPRPGGARQAGSRRPPRAAPHRRQVVRLRHGFARRSTPRKLARRTACGWRRCGRRWPPPGSPPTASNCCASAAPGPAWSRFRAGRRRPRSPTRRRTPCWSRAGRSPLAMITGDFDLSGIGTVTYIDGDRVYGWGHPFMGLGACEFPLMTGYIHTIYPRQTVSFKMGSPLRTVGVVNADVSTCIAGWLDRKPDMLPVRMTVSLGDEEAARTYNVQTVRQPSLLSDAGVHGADQLRGHGRRVAGGNDGGIRGPHRAGGPRTDRHQGRLLRLQRRPGAGGALRAGVGRGRPADEQPLRVAAHHADRVRHARHRRGGATADVESMELDSDAYEPGDEVKASVFLRPYKGAPRRLTATLKLPDDLPEGDYTVTACDGDGQPPGWRCTTTRTSTTRRTWIRCCRRCACRRRQSGRG